MAVALWARGGVCVLLLAAASCSRESADPDSVEVSIEVVAPPLELPPQYAVADSAIAAWGSVSVSVALAADTLADTLVYPPVDQEACGVQLLDNSIQREGGFLGGVIVWLPDARLGKEFPIRRRFQLIHDGCVLTPRAQGVARGGTLNVLNFDAATHVLRFTDMRTGEVLARVTQTVPGQVVPMDAMLEVSRRIEVTCETHAWTRAHIFVFDHPYFGMTDRSGTVVLDSVPAGPQAVWIWHERFGEVRRATNVAPGTGARMEVRIDRR